LEPLLDPYTVVVGRMDLSVVDPTAIESAIYDVIPGDNDAMRGAVHQARLGAEDWLQAFREAGGRELYIVVSLADLGTEPPVFTAVPLAPDSQPEALEAMARIFGSGPDPSTQVLHECVVSASTRILQRLEAHEGSLPRHLESAFAAMPPGVLQVALLPYEGSDRVIEDLMPRLPSVVGGGASSVLTRGVLWGLVKVKAPPAGELELRVQSRTPEDAQALRQVVVSGLNALGHAKQVQHHIPDWSELQEALTPTVDGDGLGLRVNQADLVRWVTTVVAPALQKARQDASQIHLMNNLKQIALVVIMYSSDHDNTLPEHLADTLPYLGSAEVLLLPNDSTRPPADLKDRTRDEQAAWLDAHSPFVYRLGGLKMSEIQSPARDVLVFQKPETASPAAIGVAFADGHAEIVTREALDDLLKNAP
jgi:hypothetical protein